MERSRQLLRNIPADLGFQSDKAAMLGDRIRGMFVCEYFETSPDKPENLLEKLRVAQVIQTFCVFSAILR
jgi:hypothetical protein